MCSPIRPGLELAALFLARCQNLGVGSSDINSQHIHGGSSWFFELFERGALGRNDRHEFVPGIDKTTWRPRPGVRGRGHGLSGWLSWLNSFVMCSSVAARQSASG